MKKISDFCRRFIRRIKDHKILYVIVMVIFSLIVVRQFSIASKIEKKYASDILANKEQISMQSLVKKKDTIREVKVIKYPTSYRFYVEVKEDKKPLLFEFKSKTGEEVISSVFDKNKIKYAIQVANFADNVGFKTIDPFALSMASTKNEPGDSAPTNRTKDEDDYKFLNSIVNMAFMLFLVSGLMRTLNGGKKFEVINTEDINGNISDLVGLDELKKQVSPLIHRNEFLDRNKEYNVDKTINLMFSGPAGTGKTKFAGYLAKELGLPLITCSGSELETGVVGGGSRTLKAIQKKARKLERCVVFIDEAQSLFMRRGAGTSTDNKYRDDTPNSLLSILDGVQSDSKTEIIWIFASNFNETNMNVDPAVMRRFKLKLDFRLPNKTERIEVFKLYLNKINSKRIDEIDYNYLGEISTGLSPAHIETIVDLAAMKCSEENKKISTNELYESFEKMAIGNTNRATTANDNEKRKLIGIHELGHFVVEFDFLMNKYNNDLKLVRENISVLKISTESVSKLGALGYVLSKQEEISLKSLGELENDIMVLYGGVAAEKTFFDERAVTVGSSNDIQKATNILKMLVFDLGMYSDSKVNYNLITSETKTNELIALIESKSKDLFADTESIIRKHRILIGYLSPILIEKYVLQVDEVMDEIEFFNKSNPIAALS